jgi:glutamate-1-semialdehyde aminotransferase
MGKGQDTYRTAKKLIPGGTGLLSKRPEMFLPDLWPAYYRQAKGSEVWDLDNRHYWDMSYMGIGACVLGYADSDVDAAVHAAIEKGSMCTLNCPEEVELAELLCKIHPWAGMVRFARTGGEAMAMAVRIARARTEKDVILFCGYHGWHDWYLSANVASDKALDGHLLPGLKPKGVPRVLRGTAVPFEYNNTAQFAALMEKYRGKVAAVVMEPVRNYLPQEDFIETIRKATREAGVVLVFDEITSGWRLTVGGAHLTFGVEPDLAVFAKGMSNGYPMAAIIGRADVMDAAQETFISSTYWTERIGPVAALATIRKLADRSVPAHLVRVGEHVQRGWLRLGQKHRLDITVSGIAPLGHFSFNVQNPLVPKTLFTQLMLKKGFLATTAFYAALSHTEEAIDRYLENVDDAFGVIACALKEGRLKDQLEGAVCQAGFKRLT